MSAYITADPAPERTWRAEIGPTIRLAWPLVLANLAATALTTIDIVLLGRLSPEAVAAAALATNLFHAAMISAIGLVTAVAPLLAAELGRRPHAVREVRRIVRQGLWSACLVSIPAWLVLWHGERLLVLMGQSPALAAESGAYLRALQWTLLPILGMVVQRSLMAALGRPGWSLAVSLAALPVNAVLAWALIFGRLGAPALGLVGAGYATAATAALGFLAVSVVLVTDRRFRRYRLFGRFWRPDWPRLATIWRLGLPIAAALAFEVAFFGAAGLAMGIIGIGPLAAHTIALQIASLCFMVPLGLAQAATIRVGHALGACDRAGIAAAGWAAFAVAMGFEAAIAAVLVAAPDRLVRIFLDTDLPRTAGVAALATQLIVIAAVFQLADGAQVVGAGMLRGLKDTRRPMLYAALGYWGVGIPLGWVLAFPAGLGGTGLWTGLACGLAIVALLTMRRWTRRDGHGLTPHTARAGPRSRPAMPGQAVSNHAKQPAQATP